MPLFTSPREKRLWQYVLLVLVAILATLFFGSPLLKMFENQDVQAAIFLLGMALIGAAMVANGLKIRPGKRELVVWLGLAAVYLMLLLRLGLAERSHLIEYSVLAIFIHLALAERFRKGSSVLKPALLAFLLTVIIGALDECAQLFLPERVFDPVDILFNSLAALLAVGSALVLQRVGKRWQKRG